MLASAVTVLAGAGLYTLALPPFDCAALGWTALVPLFLVLRGRSVRAGFAYGLLYGCGFGWGVTWWSVQAVTRYFDIGLPLALLGLQIFYLAAFVPTFGVFGVGASILLQRERGRFALFGIPALWVVCEIVRGRFLGQPWGLLGYSQHANTALIQIAALTGVYGVSFLLDFGNVALAQAMPLLRARRFRAARSSLVIPVAVIGFVWAAGAMVMRHGLAGGFAARPVAIVQTGVAPAYQWTRAYAERQLLAHIRATEGLVSPFRPALVVWPENAITQYLESEPMLAETLGELAKRRRADLLFGAPRYEAGRTYNSVRLITADGRNGGYYDKQHLVLFAEAGLLSGPNPSGRSESPREFSPGTESGILHSFVALGVSICHEVTFPEIISHTVREGAELLVNVSNDGWLDHGHGAASRQHFAMAVFRAVETRRALVRGATTGISGVVDPYGRLVAVLEPGAVGVVTASVAGRNTLTPYVRFGDLFALLCLVGCVMAVLRAQGVSLRARTRALPASTLP